MQPNKPKTTSTGAKLTAMAGAIAVLAGGRGVADVPKTKATTHPDVSGSVAYHSAVQKTAGMVSDATAQHMAKQHGLDILNLTWEDTGQFKGSSVGPNISDMTIQVAARNPQTRQLDVTCMPVIRYPNFSDKTCDLDPRDFELLVGNQASGSDGNLKRVSLYEFLQEPTAFLTHPASWSGNKAKSLIAPNRDSKVLVSAQACFLPVPKQGKATFNPIVFNYQSYAKNPAVLTILATREGTSATVIDNTRDAFETGAVWGQRLFHNAHGQRASLTGERESDFKANHHNDVSPDSPAVAKTETGLNMVLLIQVPLKQQERPRRMYEMEDKAMAAPGMSAGSIRRRAASNVENAVIGHGAMEGPFTEIDNLPVERDPRYPVRVTVQFYKATDNGVVSADDLQAIKTQIDRVYAHSDSVGSLVTNGETGRVTEYAGAKVQPADWWQTFWRDYEAHFHVPREVAIQRLRKLLGHDYERQPVTDLYARHLLRHHSA